MCRSSGWYPQPEALWKDPGGQHLPSVSRKRSSDERGLSDVEDVTVVTGHAGGTWSRVLRNSRLSQQQGSPKLCQHPAAPGCPCSVSILLRRATLL